MCLLLVCQDLLIWLFEGFIDVTWWTDMNRLFFDDLWRIHSYRGKTLELSDAASKLFQEGICAWIHGSCIYLMLLMIISRILIKIPQITATWTLTFLDSWTRMLVNSHPSTPWRLPFSVLCHQSCHAVAPCGSCRTTRLQTLGTCLGGIKGGIDCDLEGYGYCFLRVILSDSWQHLIFK